MMTLHNHSVAQHFYAPGPAHAAPHANTMIIIVCYSIIIHNIGRAAFASEENETLALPANGGGSVSFNATVIYTSGGGCNYRQNLTLIKLRKRTGDIVKNTYVCNFRNGSCHPNIQKSVNLSRGDSGFEFVLTLFNLTTDGIGTYEVIVESSHPGSGSNLQLTKRFHLVGKST